jgi:hypothetical protein
MTDTPSPRPIREPRTFELRDAEWIEDAATRRTRASFWLLVPVVLAAATGIVLVSFAAFAALATRGLGRLRARILRGFGR